MFCPTCGKQLADNAKFCDSCGSVLNQASQQGYASPQPPPVQPTYVAPPVIVQQPQAAYYPPQQPAGSSLTEPMSVGAYIGFYLLMCIPLANIILLFVWAFGSDVNINRKNLSRTLLIFMLIGIAFSIIFGSLLFGVIRDLMESMYYSW
jgi:hypothetical protein